MRVLIAWLVLAALGLGGRAHADDRPPDPRPGSAEAREAARKEFAAGYALSGGVRWDLVRRERGGVSLLAESGLRHHRTTDSGSGSASDSDGGFIVPLMASVLYLYK